MVKVDFELVPPPHGLVFDGDVRGRFTGEAVQDMATSYGWAGAYLSADAEFYDEAITEAEDWLNAHVVEDGSIFHWFNGSFFYEPLAQIEEQY
jgi:hypothetical protein